MNEDIKNLYWIPMWEEKTWNALQQKNYQEAGERLEILLSHIPPDEWKSVFWIGIIKGIPIVRGGLTEHEWKEGALPEIVKAILETANGEAVTNIFRRLSAVPELIAELRDVMVAVTPGKDRESKLNWIKTKSLSLYNFFVGNPGQELGTAFLIQEGSKIPVTTAIERYKTLPQTLKNKILSQEITEKIVGIGVENHLSQEKIALISTVVGRTYMGFIQIEDVQKELQKLIPIDARIIETISEELNKKVFKDFEEEIRKIYKPIIVTEKDKIPLAAPSPEPPAAKKPGSTPPAPAPAAPAPAAPAPAAPEPPQPTKLKPAPHILASQKPSGQERKSENKKQPLKIIESDIPAIQKSGAPKIQESAIDQLTVKTSKVEMKQPPAETQETKKSEYPDKPVKPFILHEEKPIAQKPKIPRFSFSLPNIFKREKKKPSEAVPAKVEIPAASLPQTLEAKKVVIEKKPEIQPKPEKKPEPQTKSAPEPAGKKPILHRPEPKRVVHYSEYRTPVPYENEEIIDLTTLRRIKPGERREQQSGKPEQERNNTVDLRKTSN